MAREFLNSSKSIFKNLPTAADTLLFGDDAVTLKRMRETLGPSEKAALFLLPEGKLVNHLVRGVRYNTWDKTSRQGMDPYNAIAPADRIPSRYNSNSNVLRKLYLTKEVLLNEDPDVLEKEVKKYEDTRRKRNMNQIFSKENYPNILTSTNNDNKGVVTRYDIQMMKQNKRPIEIAANLLNTNVDGPISATDVWKKRVIGNKDELKNWFRSIYQKFMNKKDDKKKNDDLEMESFQQIEAKPSNLIEVEKIKEGKKEAEEDSSLRQRSGRSMALDDEGKQLVRTELKQRKLTSPEKARDIKPELDKNDDFLEYKLTIGNNRKTQYFYYDDKGLPKHTDNLNEASDNNRRKKAVLNKDVGTKRKDFLSNYFKK